MKPKYRSRVETSETYRTPVSNTTILFYTTYFGHANWPYTTGNYAEWGNLTCEDTNCIFTFDKGTLYKADAVVFHGSDFSTEKLRTLSKNRKKNQKWIFY